MRFLLLLLVLFAVSCVKEEEASGGSLASGAPTKWKSGAFPIALKISDEFSSSEISNLGSMANEWETAVDNQINFFQTGSISTKTFNNMDSFQDSEMGIYKTYIPMNGLPANALAVTQIFGWERSGYIEVTHADVIVNYFDFDFSDDFTFGTYDLPTVVLHELGHFLGLYHVNDYAIDSVMHPSISSLTIARATYSRDQTDIKKNYGLIQSNQPLVIGAGISSGRSISSEPVPVRILMELHADGECVHRKDGKVIHRHKASDIKKH